MAKQYTKEELWAVYDKLPQELQQAIFSGETADQIFTICERHGVDAVSKVAYYAGLVLMGVLLPDELQSILVKEAGVKKSAAPEIFREINRFVFYPVKPALEQLHSKVGEQKEAAAPQKKPAVPAGEGGLEQTAIPSQPSSAPPQPEKAQNPPPAEESKKEDPYREGIE